jgi:hypothetical protein
MNINGDLVIEGTEKNLTDLDSKINNIDEDFEGLKGKILWTNPNPNSEFSPQSIEVNLDGLDAYEIMAYQNLDNKNRLITTGKIAKGYGSVLNYTVSNRYRAFNYTDNKITFQDGNSGGNVDNKQLIPLYVVGYNTGLFS